MSEQPTHLKDHSLGTPASLSFPDWAVRELDRLLQVRAQARTAEERFQAELQAAILREAADRYGRHLAEAAEL